MNGKLYFTRTITSIGQDYFSMYLKDDKHYKPLIKIEIELEDIPDLLTNREVDCKFILREED